MSNGKQANIKVDDIYDAPSNVPGASRSLSPDQVNTLYERILEAGLEIDQLRGENRDLKSKLKTKDILDDLIEPYANRAFIYMCWYSAVVAFILFLCGANKYYEFDLPESVLNFLVGSTAVTVIGLVGMVLTGIFVARPK